MAEEDPDVRIDQLEHRIRDLEAEASDAEDERNDADGKLEQVARAIDDCDDIEALRARAPEILGYGSVGAYWPSWNRQ